MTKQKSELFKFYEASELLNVNPKHFAYFGWEGNDYLSLFTIAEAYKEGANTIFNQICNCSNNKSNIDSLVYPLCFTHRHSMELYLKFLFFKYSNGTDKDKERFLNNNHDLNMLWSDVKAHLTRNKRKVGTSVDIGAIEQDVRAFAKFDADSMKMRYSIDKNLTAQHKTTRLDVYNFHYKMTAFYSNILQLNYDFDNQIEQTSQENIDLYLLNYELNKKSVLEYIAFMSKFITQNDVENFGEINIDELLDDDQEYTQRSEYFENLSSNERIIIETLYYAGNMLKNVNLSKAPKDTVADFVSICVEHMKLHNFHFDINISSDSFNVNSKDASTIVRYIEEAMRIIKP